MPIPSVRLLPRRGTWEQNRSTHIVPPIWTLAPLNVAWCTKASERQRCRSFQAQAGTRRTELGRLGCDGTVACTRVSSCVFGWTYPFFWWEIQIGAATLCQDQQVWRPRTVSMTCFLLQTNNNFVRMALLACSSSMLWMDRSKRNSPQPASHRAMSECLQQHRTELHDNHSCCNPSWILHPGVTGRLWGRLGYSCAQLFGHFGRAKLCFLPSPTRTD